MVALESQVTMGATSRPRIPQKPFAVVGPEVDGLDPGVPSAQGRMYLAPLSGWLEGTPKGKPPFCRSPPKKRETVQWVQKTYLCVVGI